MTSTADLFNTDSVEDALRDVAADDATENPEPDAAAPADDTADHNGRIIFLDPKKVSPHPFNAPSRSEPDPDDPIYVELRDDIKATGGNKVPGLVVTVEAFLATRPGAKVAEGCTHVAIYCHRRRAVAIETGTLLKVEVDDSVMQDDGDLVALASENKGRKGFSELDEALMYQKSIEAGVSQRQLVKILPGVSQATISRRLALLLLVPEVRDAMLGRNKAFKDVNGKPKKLPSADAAVIAGAFPYGEPGNGKRKKNQAVPEATPERYKAQLAVLTRLHDYQWEKAATACDHVTRKLEARAEAEKMKATVVDDPRKAIGDNYHKHAISSADAIKEAAAKKTLVAQVADTGAVTYFTTEKPKPKPKPEPKPHEVAEKERAALEREARTARWAALKEAAKKPLGQHDMRRLMLRSLHNGMAQLAGNTNSGKLAQRLCAQGDIGPAFGDEWIEQMAANTDPAVDLLGAWVRMLAAHENNVRATYHLWGALEIEYYEILAKRGGHEPTEWDKNRLAEARRRVEAAEAAKDVEPEDVEPDGDEPEDVEPEDVEPEDVEPEDVEPEDVEPHDDEEPEADEAERRKELAELAELYDEDSDV